MLPFSFYMANNTLLVLLGEAFSSLLCFISTSFFISGKGYRHIGEIRLSPMWASNPRLRNGSPVARWASLSPYSQIQVHKYQPSNMRLSQVNYLAIATAAINKCNKKPGLLSKRSWMYVCKRERDREIWLIWSNSAYVYLERGDMCVYMFLFIYICK